jgi:putative flippase GtrA
MASTNLSARSLVTFLFVGGFATALHYALLSFFHVGFGVPFVYASTLGFLISAVVNYLLTARVTFRSAERHRVTAPRFVVVAGSGLALNALLLSSLLSLHVHPIGAQVCTTIVVIFWNYFINALWTFKRQAPTE